MEPIQKITKESILNEEYNKFFKKKTMLALQISLQKKLSPSEISAKKPLSYDTNGNPISWEKITRGEYIGILEKELEDVNQVLETITTQ